jgi:hypothetical protein
MSAPTPKQPNPSVPESSRPGSRITMSEVQQALAPHRDQYPPLLTLIEAAALARIQPGTLKRKVSEGAFPVSARRGKPLRFLRDRFVYELMNRTVKK